MEAINEITTKWFGLARDFFENHDATTDDLDEIVREHVEVDHSNPAVWQKAVFLRCWLEFKGDDEGLTTADMMEKRGRQRPLGDGMRCFNDKQVELAAQADDIDREIANLDVADINTDDWFAEDRLMELSRKFQAAIEGISAEDARKWDAICSK